MEQKYLMFFLKLCSFSGLFPLRLAGGAWKYSWLFAGFSFLPQVLYCSSQYLIWTDLSPTLSNVVYGTIEPILIAYFFINLTISRKSMTKIMDSLTDFIFTSENTRNFYPMTMWVYIINIIALAVIPFIRGWIFDRAGIFYLDIAFSITIIQFLCTIMLLTWIIRMCTLELSRINDELFNSSTLTYDDITCFVTKHERVVELIEMFINHHGQVVLTVTVTALLEISVQFSDSLRFLLSSEDKHVLKSSANFTWTVAFIWVMWDLMNSCEDTYDQVKTIPSGYYPL